MPTSSRWYPALLLAGLSVLMADSANAGDDDTGRSAQRAQMVAQQLEARGIDDRRVLVAMGEVPRHRLVPAEAAYLAYADRPLPIGHGQTISQPYIVALMTQLARPQADDRALEVGTGSGYQAAVLARLVEQVYTIEIVDPLARRATDDLAALGVDNVEVRSGDGYAGWPEQAPFDIILVTAAPEQVPQPLLDQLAPGGRMVVPVGPVRAVQQLRLLEKDRNGEVHVTEVAPVRFVPFTRKRASPTGTP